MKAICSRNNKFKQVLQSIHRMNKKFTLFIAAIGLWVCSCVEPFNLKVASNLKILTVDATLTNLPGEQTISITESTNFNGSVFASPVLKAKVEIIVDKKERILLTEKTNGNYALPASFALKTGIGYQLVFQKSDGSKYESSEDKVSSVPVISDVRDNFVIEGIPRGNFFDPASYVYIDTQDPAGEKNNYMWSWRLWERQSVCATCSGGRYFLTPTAGCRIERGYAELTYDYNCGVRCWEIFSSDELDVFTDVLSDGRKITNKLVAKIPYYSFNGALMEIKQQSISADAYRYLKLLADQVQNNGSLVDTPPAAIIGNIKNVSNPEESIAGFFMVTNVNITRYWLSRVNAQTKATPKGILGHEYIPEPTGADLTRPPFALCVSSKNRTPQKPEGWVD